ncbi:MAG TPA: NADH-quinone oxidoreductase subunit L [Fimbriimonadaceae bacterium]|nr:NADH-quinone oxidoreductase subunit L [Fimbriimonadaceae bacterium]
MSDKFGLIWWVLFLPVIGFLIQAFFGGRVVKSMGPAAGRRAMGAIATLVIAVAFVIGVVVTQQLAALPDTARNATTTLFPWIQLSGLSIPFEFRVDPLSMTMVLIVTGVGGLIHLYATGYMHEEKDYTRFFTYLNLFIAAMLILVLGNNLVMMFIGWEGVGLCSYLLIGFWYKDLANARAANKAFIVNRIGDWGFSLGIFLLAVLVGSQPGIVQHSGGKILSYDTLFQVLPNVLQAHPALATTAALLLFVGACGKSAQFPLYLWLPDAMAGPTPVSALIHAATMVTSGVVLLNRMHIVFEMSPVASAVVACIGAFTALFAALVAFGQTDIKKVLAYSTVSQLGFMFVACGAGAYWVGMFHVTTHAFFKALLFLGSGSVIMAMAHDQDMRNYGKLAKYLPVTFWTMFAGYLAISGFPFFSAFFSKEPIIGYALANDFASATINGQVVHLGQIAGWTALFVALLTAFYMTRMMWLTFFGPKEQWRAIPAHAHAHDDHEEAALEAAHGEESHAALAHTDDHGPDVHGFFYTHEEVHAIEHGDHEHEHHALDANHVPKERYPSMLVPLIVLAVLSAGGGWYLANGQMFEKWLEPSSAPLTLHLSEEAKNLPLGLSLMQYSMIAAFVGMIGGALIYWKGLPKKEGWDERKWSWFRLWARNQFSYDPAMMTAAVQGGNDVGQLFWRFFDAGIVDGIVNGLAKLAGWFGSLFHRIQTGYVRLYALVMLAGGVGLIGWFAYAAFLAGGGK